MTRLANKTVLITGAAGGIGSEISRACAIEGANLVLTDLNEAALELVVKEIQATGGPAVAVAADATDDAAMAAACQRAVDDFGSLDAVFANAGIPMMAPLEEIDRDLFQRVFTTNTYSVIAAAKAAAPIMAAQSTGGRLINTCSVAGKVSWPGHTLYSATKFAIRSLTQGLAKELADRRITVNSICPGMIDTTLWDSIGKRMEEEGQLESAKDVLDAFSGDVLAGRPGRPSDLIGLAVFLASDESAYINGQCINVDGGLVFD